MVVLCSWRRVLRIFLSRICDPFFHHIHATVDRVMAHRKNDRPFHVAFQGKLGPVEWLAPGIHDSLDEIRDAGKSHVLVVPVALVTEHIETSYKLDIELREQARRAGIAHFEVMPALNCHPLFIEALAEATIGHLTLPLSQTNGSSNGSSHAIVAPHINPRS